VLGYGRADGGTLADFAAGDGGGGNPTARAATSSPAKTLDLSGDKREGAQMPPFAFAALAAANGKPDKNAEADPVLANARRLLAAANGASGVAAAAAAAERAPSGGAGLALPEDGGGGGGVPDAKSAIESWRGLDEQARAQRQQRTTSHSQNAAELQVSPRSLLLLLSSSSSPPPHVCCVWRITSATDRGA
jgi:hypothetical protein